MSQVRALRRPHSAFIVFFFLMSAGLSSSCGETFSRAPFEKPHAGAAGSPIGEPSGGGEGGAEAGGNPGTGGAPNPSATAGSGGEGGADTGVGGEETSGTSGSTGSGGEGPNPPERCDWTAPVDGCTVSAKDGIFVTPEGDDSADGTPDQPLASIGEGVARARAMVTPLPVFVCTATYDEHVEIRTSDVRLQGGFTCPENSSDAWVYSAGTRPRLAPSTQGYALRVRDAERVTVADFALETASGVALGDSSIAVFATHAIDVAFERTLIQSGNGADGEPGVLTPHQLPEPPEPNLADEETGAAPLTCTCPGTNILSVGGRGGNGGEDRTGGGAGEPLYPGTGAGALIGQSCSAGGLGTGQIGGDAPAASPAPGARELGAVSVSGWQRSKAEAGATGAPGQGGGGGAGLLTGAKLSALGGSSGECGGCGGNGGGGGTAGGASIGILSYLSRVTLRESEIRTGQGGTGGAGASGQDGQRPLKKPQSGCQSGGIGGFGGTGGTGGGGAGGISVGVVWTGGTEPTLEGTHVFTGEPGEPGGAEGVNRGIPGVSLRVLFGRAEALLRVD